MRKWPESVYAVLYREYIFSIVLKVRGESITELVTCVILLFKSCQMEAK